ncbi:MAG TPA: acetylglutamate kinase [Gemmatimonadaceae bacterium]|nr:acetylglutamate kinase [Gemmatimonadaceae bacterium]
MRVIKLGGRAQRDPTLVTTIASAWRESPRRLVVVHGGGDEVTSLQRRMGAEPEFRGGRRITTPQDIALLRMVLSGAVNKRLVAELVAAGVPAVGVSGEDAGLMSARRAADGALGRVGTPSGVEPLLIASLLAGGFLPVVSPLARDEGDERGGALNVNGDDAAVALALALSADELLFVADVPGVLRDGRVVESLDAIEARSLHKSGAAVGGMALKLEAAIAAATGGVARVRIGAIASLLNPDAGTVIAEASVPI